jgi:hypothetical protein
LTFERRLEALEREIGVGAVTWGELRDASDRQAARAISDLCRFYGREPKPGPLLAGDSPELAERDAATVGRYRVENSLPGPDEGAVDRLAEKLGRLERSGQLEERLRRFCL